MRDGTDCRDCVFFYMYVCNLNSGKEHIWDYCSKFERRTFRKPPGTVTLKEIQDMIKG